MVAPRYTGSPRNARGGEYLRHAYVQRRMERMKAADKQWLRGYVMALADVNRHGGQTSLCKELLRAAGVETEGEAVAVAVEEYDLVEVRKILADGQSLGDISEAELAVALRDGTPVDVKADDLGTAAASLVKILTDAGAFKSRSEARRFVGQGGVSINGEKTTDYDYTLGAHDVDEGRIVLRKGTQTYVVVRVAGETA